MKLLRIGILGASGYTGAEMVRLLHDHPQVAIAWLTADRKAGSRLGQSFPHLATLDLPQLVHLEDAALDQVDLVFCCLPHGMTQEIVRDLPRDLRIVDLSADFRLRDPLLYERTYGQPHRALERQREAVYGLTEHYREAIPGARLIANPGCYTTTAELPLIPLLTERLIDPSRIVIDAKSGVTGAGRALKEASLFAELSEGLQAYAVASHRHTPEIEQCLADFAGEAIAVTFTPHLVPMNRGIFATIYVDLARGVRLEMLQEALASRYAPEPFVHVLPQGEHPSTRHVRGSNHCLIALHESRIDGRAILLAVTDNLVKGAAGQAIQNMNVMLGLDETLGLRGAPLFP